MSKKKIAIEPLGNSVMIDVEIKSHTKSGLALPDSHDYIQEKATVLAVGPDVKDQRIKPGATVFFKSWALQTAIYDDEKADFVDEDKCLAVVPKKK